MVFVVFNPERLAAAAEELSKQLSLHEETNEELVQSLRGGFEPLIAKAKACNIKKPLENLPGGRMIIDGHLDSYPELLRAVSDFRHTAMSDHDELDEYRAWAERVAKEPQE